jgi:hypothetical protein
MNVNGRILNKYEGTGRMKYRLGAKNIMATAMMLLSVEHENESAVMPIMIKE